jgi:hypothetical protein
MGAQFRDVMDRLLVARVNDGRLPVVPNPTIMTKRGEVVHGEVPAALLKTVTVREQHGSYGYQGVSFRIAKGVRYSTGVGRKPRVTTHQEIQTEDTGMLVITSQRVVFVGQGGTTIEMPYSKLVNLTLYTDGLDFHLSMRTYGHVIDELEDAPKLSAEDAIEAAPAANVSVLCPPAEAKSSAR